MESAGGGTPLNWALKEMKTYLDTHKAADAIFPPIHAPWTTRSD
jgi:hypothetical protein